MRKVSIALWLMPGLVAIAQAASPVLSLTPDSTCYTIAGATVTVAVELTQSSPEDEVLGGQFFMDYDDTALSLSGVTTGTAPFTQQVYADTSTSGQVDFAVGIPNGSSGYSSGGPITMATLTFTTLVEDCSAADLVTFRDTSGVPYDTRLTRRVGATGSEPLAVSTLNDMGPVTLDYTGPVISGVPLDLTLECTDSIPTADPNEAWGLWANSGGVADAVRTFDAALGTGDTFKIDMDNGWVESGGTVGLGLRNSADENRLEVYFVAGNTNYTVHDNSGARDSGVPFTDEGLHIEVTITGADSYSITIFRLEDGTSATLTGTLGGTTSTAIDRVRLFNANAGSGTERNLFFNNIAINSTAFDYANDPVYDDGWGTGDDGGTGFGAWTLGDSGSHGHFIATSTTNGDGDSNSDGDIDGVLAADNCGGSVTLNFNETSDLTGCNGTGTITRTWTATDGCSNQTIATQVITIQDSTAPTVTPPNATSLTCSSDLPAAATTIAEFRALSGASASDNCTDPNDLTVSAVTGALVGDDCGGTITRTYTIADLCGNEVDVDHVFNVADTVLPTITNQPTGLTVECDGTGLASQIASWLASNGGATAADNCGAITWSNDFDPNDFVASCGGTGSIDVTFTATDDCGNSTATNAATFTIEDTTGPTIDTQPSDQTVECDGTGVASQIASWLASNGGAAASDTCGGTVSWTNDFDPNDFVTTCGGAGYIDVVFTATDACGNATATDSARFTIEDTTAPTASQGTIDSCYASQAAAEQAALDTTTGLSDGCSGVTKSVESVTGTCSAAIVVRVEDACGNFTDYTYNTRIDGDAPVATAPTAETVECVGDVPAGVTTYAAYVAAGGTVSDACTDPNELTIAFADVSDGNSCPEVITRTYTITDECGNDVQVQQTITVDDTIAPTFDTFPGDLVLECDQSTDPNDTGEPTASDNCDATPTITYSDSVLAGVITRTWTVTDDCGNSTSQDQTITVEDTTDPTITAPSDVQIECDVDPNDPNFTGWPTVADNCDADPTVTFTDVVTPGACASEFTITRTWQVEDNAGNTATDDQVITVVDTTAPTFAEATDALDITVQCSDSTDPAATGEPTPSDNCGLASTDPLTYSDVTNLTGCNGTGTITRTWTATDACGNTTTYEQVITVIDTTAPTFAEAPNALDTIIECSDSSDPASTGQPTPTDNCGLAAVPLTYSDAITPGACPNAYTITRTWTAEDACGNTADYVQTITVQDTTAPTFTVPPGITLNADAGGCTLTLTTGDIGTPTDLADNCSAEPNLAVIWVRSDAAVNLDDPFGQGSTTITWTVTDECGNASSQDQTVTVLGFNDVLVDIQMQDISVAVTRCIKFSFLNCTTMDSAIVEADIAFDASGFATGVVLTNLPCGTYDCITAEDDLHSLMVRLESPDFGISGVQYYADFTDQSGSGGSDNMLYTADYYDDELIDIADFGVYIAQWGAVYDSDGDTNADGDTPCGSSWPPDGLHADANGDGVLDISDFNPISGNFLMVGESGCCGLARPYGGARSSVPVWELEEAGVTSAWRADFNADGWVDLADVSLFLNGATPRELPVKKYDKANVQPTQVGGVGVPLRR